MKQEIFKHSTPYGVTQLRPKQIISFDTILAGLILKQEFEEQNMKLRDITQEQCDEINDAFEESIYLKSKARKLIRDIKNKYGITDQQIYRLISKPIQLMKRHGHE